MSRPTLLQGNSGHALRQAADRVGAKRAVDACKEFVAHEATVTMKSRRPPASDMPAVASVPSDSCSKGAISLLQEFVQCSKQHKQIGPQNRPILQWDFDTRMADFAALQFRATVAFLLDGVPHHSVGDWHLSKKHAQRDAAERALGFYVGRWGQHILANSVVVEASDDCTAESVCNDSSDFMSSVPSQSTLGCDSNILQQLDDFCRRCPVLRKRPQWSVRRNADGASYQAFLEVLLLGVPHKFGGPATCDSETRACEETARRVLWYLQCPGFEDLFELDPHAPAATARDIPAPPEQWVPAASCGDCEDGYELDAQQLAERKTALMRVQNRLQQAFARQLRPGQSVWEWTFETDSGGTGWPPLCRATASVPVAGKQFAGEWARGQREAQLSVCTIVSEFLDAMRSGRVSPKPKSP